MPQWNNPYGQQSQDRYPGLSSLQHLKATVVVKAAVVVVVEIRARSLLIELVQSLDPK